MIISYIIYLIIFIFFCSSSAAFIWRQCLLALSWICQTISWKFILYHTIDNIQKDSEKEFPPILTYFLTSPMLFFPAFLPYCPQTSELHEEAERLSGRSFCSISFFLSPLAKSSAAGQPAGSWCTSQFQQVSSLRPWTLLRLLLSPALCYFSFIAQCHSSPQQLQFFLFLPFLQTALLRKPSAIICSLRFLPICFLSFAVSLWPWEDRQR